MAASKFMATLKKLFGFEVMKLNFYLYQVSIHNKALQRTVLASHFCEFALQILSQKHATRPAAELRVINLNFKYFLAFTLRVVSAGFARK